MRKAAISSLMMVVLTACGGGGGSTSVSPSPTPVPTPVPEPQPLPIVIPIVLTPLQQAQKFFTDYDASLATAPPTTGAQLNALVDGCSLNNGYTKVASIAEFDADAVRGAAANKYRVGSTRTNIQVLADRAIINFDGSARRELDVQYQINYADGTIEKDLINKLIAGSSFGSVFEPRTLCTTPETGTNWRLYGDREIVGIQVRAVNQRSERFSLANGAPFANPVEYSKFVQFRITDPRAVANYVIVTGPGLPTSGLKMLSPRILRDDPLLAGKRGNFVDWNNNDTFRICRGDLNGNVVAAANADCTTFGVATANFGMFNQTPVNADTNFNALGFFAGGIYTIAVHNDDGWKTVNGQSGKTAVKTYLQKLIALPASAASLAGTSVITDLFPRMTSSVSAVAIADAIRTKTPVPVNLSWNLMNALPDTSKLGWGDIYSFVSGRAALVNGITPGSRRIEFTYPNAGATSAASFTVGTSATTQPALVTPTYSEFGLELTNRNGSRLLSLITFE